MWDGQCPPSIRFEGEYTRHGELRAANRVATSKRPTHAPQVVKFLQFRVPALFWTPLYSLLQVVCESRSQRRAQACLCSGMLATSGESGHLGACRGGGLEALFRTPGSGQDSEISAACFGLCISGHTPEFAYGAKARCKLSRFSSKCSFVAGIWACSLDMSTTDS